jgi:uncharacterized protein (TIGR00251 family)
MSAYFQSNAQGYVLRLTVVPGARRTEVVGLLGDRLKVRLAAAPEKGAANQELIAFLAQALGLPKSSLKLTGGFQSRTKVVTISDPAAELGERLCSLVPESR